MRIAICDDEPDFTERMRTLVESGLVACEEKTDISIYQEGAAFCSSDASYDAVFLDIDMPQVNGFDIAEEMNRKGNAFLIFVTMHDELVYSSIRFQPFRFIRKSHLEEELPEVLEDLHSAVYKRRAGQKFAFQTREGTVFLDVGSITYIEIYGHWIHVRVEDGRDVECYGSLLKLEKELAPFAFIRTHKSYLVNCKYIYAIEKGQCILDDGTKIFLSRHRAEEVRARFRDYIRSNL